MSDTSSKPMHETHGCDVCRKMSQLFFEFPVMEVGHLGGGDLLFRCSACGALWEQTLRLNAPISEVEARKLCPLAFATV